MASRGAVRRHKDNRFYIDFGHNRRIWSMPVGRDYKIPLTEELANNILQLIRAKLGEGRGIDEAIAQFQPDDAKPNLVPAKLAEWIEAKRREVRAGDRSPTYLGELERYCKDGGHFSFWSGRSVHEATRFALLEDYGNWLAERGLGAKARFNVLAAFHAFLGWLYKREHIREMPRNFPWPKVPEAEPAVLSIAAQRAVLEAIPDDRRGIFLALGLLGLRPSEAVALLAGDVRDGWITISRARKGARLDAPVRGTKSGAVKRLPVPEELGAWISKYMPPKSLIPAPLFTNPETGGPWAKSALRRTWEAACRKVGVRIGLYNGTKHTVATHWKSMKIDDATIGALLGHSRGSKSTQRYARLSENALVEVIKR